MHSDRIVITTPAGLLTVVTLTVDDVQRMAHLARLGLDEAALEPLKVELAAVLSLVETMNAADTQGVEPMAHPVNAVLRLRPDEVTEENQRERLMAPAPQVEEGYFLVPRVIE